jgi:hypothetical protein
LQSGGLTGNEFRDQRTVFHDDTQELSRWRGGRSSVVV